MIKKKIYNSIKSILPENETIDLKSEVDYYGFSHYISSKLSLINVPLSHSVCSHGWTHRSIKYLEEIISVQVKNNNILFLSENQKQQQELLKLKYFNSLCIGVPYIYIDDGDYNVERHKNTLLVMPQHTVDGDRSIVKSNEENYIKTINKIKNDFDLVIFCIHKSCIKNNLWISTIEKYGYQWFLGADIYDKNALSRMNILFRSFEYVTSNCIGSHIAYSSYSGCKTSIYGEYSEPDKNQMKNSLYIKENPHMLENIYTQCLSKTVKRKYPMFFKKHPKDATLNIDWAKKELGEECKITYQKLAELLGWFRIESNKSTIQNEDILFSRHFNIFYNNLENLKKQNKRYIIYGYGTVGKIVYSFLKKNIVRIVDKNNYLLNIKKIYSPEEVYNIEFDYIIICAIGRENDIIKSFIKIPTHKFIRLLNKANTF